MPSRSSSSSTILWVGIGNLLPHSRAGGIRVEVGHAYARPQNPRHDVERDVAGMRLAKGPEHLDAAIGRQCRGLPCYSALADAWGPHHVDDTTAAGDRALHHFLEDRHSQRRPTRLASARPTIPSRGLIAKSRRVNTGSSDPLMPQPFWFSQLHAVLDQPRGRLRQHHCARWCY
jgi:hypothetical protein